MAFVRKIRRGKHTYAYLVENYREGEKVKQRTLEYLGKVTTTDGEEVIIPPIHQRIVKSVKKRGVDILDTILSDFRKDLSTSFGKSRGEKLYYLALLEFLNPSPLRYVEWNGGENGICVKLDSVALSKLLGSVSEGEAYHFFRGLCTDDSTVVFDITSLSYYGDSLNTAEYGYNRDGQHLPQVNLCLAVKGDSIPTYFRILMGSIPDVSTVNHTVDELSSLGYKDVHLVFDRGFYSEKNIQSLSAFSYTGALPKRLNLFKDIVRENLDIEHLGNFVSFKDEKIMVKEILRGEIKYVLVHNPTFKHEQQETFMEKLSRLEEMVKELVAKDKNPQEIENMLGKYAHYYQIRKNGAVRKKKAIQRTVNLMGKYILFTNVIDRPWEEVLSLYRSKDIAEKAFYVLKNSGFLMPLRIWTDKTLYGKVFAGFLFYYVYSAVMNKTDFTYEEVRRLLNGMYLVEYDNGKESHVELTRKQKKLCSQLGVSL